MRGFHTLQASWLPELQEVPPPEPGVVHTHVWWRTINTEPCYPALRHSTLVSSHLTQRCEARVSQATLEKQHEGWLPPVPGRVRLQS